MQRARNPVKPKAALTKFIQAVTLKHFVDKVLK
jgi:hypothetical protein